MALTRGLFCWGCCECLALLGCGLSCTLVLIINRPLLPILFPPFAFERRVILIVPIQMMVKFTLLFTIQIKFRFGHIYFPTILGLFLLVINLSFFRNSKGLKPLQREILSFYVKVLFCISSKWGVIFLWLSSLETVHQLESLPRVCKSCTWEVIGLSSAIFPNVDLLHIF